MTPEQTLLNTSSDCDDRVALFYCLVREIYNLPMLVLEYPDHVTMAVQLDKPVGQPVTYNGNAYTICEPTPQARELGLGQLPSTYAQSVYKIVYHYQPSMQLAQRAESYY